MTLHDTISRLLRSGLWFFYLQGYWGPRSNVLDERLPQPRRCENLKTDMKVDYQVHVNPQADFS